MRETQVRSLRQENPLEKGVATHSSVLAWRIPWTEEPRGATVHGVIKSGTRLSYWHFHFHKIMVCSRRGKADTLSSVALTVQLRRSVVVWLCDPVDCSMPGLLVRHQLPEFTQTHVHWVGDAIQPSHPLSSPSPLAFNLSQHQGLFQWVGSSHQVAKVLEFQLHQSFWWKHSGLWQHKSNSWQLSCMLWYGPFHVWCWRKLSLVADVFWLLVLLTGVVKEAYLRPAAAMLALTLYLLKLCRILEENEYILWNKRHTHIHLFRSLCSSSPSEIILREKL